MPLPAGITKKELLGELARRLREEKADMYKPHPGQERFHKSQAKIRGIFASNRWGKTWSGAMEMYWHVTKQHPYWPILSPGAVTGRACCVDFHTMQKAMLDDTFKKLIPRRFLRGGAWDKAYSQQEKTLYFTKEAPIFGGFIEFLSYDQEDDAYAGVARHVIWEDEECPEGKHTENLARLGTTSGILYITMTPIRPSLWVISDVFEKAETDKNIEIFSGNYMDNPYIDAEHVRFMISQINDPVERDARLTGSFTWYAGKIYPTYGDKHRVNYFTPPKEWALIVAIDPHDTKETAITYAYWDLKESLYVLEEDWVSGDVEYIATKIKAKCHGRKPDAWLIDPSSDRDPKIHGTESIYRKFQLHFPDVVKWTSEKGSVWMGIEDVRGMLKVGTLSGLPHLFVSPSTCPMTDWQMSHYGLKPPTQADKVRYNPLPIKVKDDFCDCVRGTVMFGRPDRLNRFRGLIEAGDRFGLGEFV